MRVRPVIAAIMPLFLGACEAPVLLGLIEHNNYRAHGRSAAGWIATVADQKDCDPWRIIDRKPVCRQDQEPTQPEAFCYASLGSVVCFDSQDPLLPRSKFLPAPGQTR